MLWLPYGVINHDDDNDRNNNGFSLWCNYGFSDDDQTNLCLIFVINQSVSQSVTNL